MAKQLLKLRHVPADELEEIQELLSQHDIDFYETSAGNWGISLPALWIRDEDEYPRARALLDEYSEERARRVRAEFEAMKREGRERRFLDVLREKPLRTILYLGLVIALIYVSTVPFIALLAA